ncbi:nucleotidyl transferase AbiEii/AbiGii toxin family protein [Candidatus Peregrinibacteria bacterium]|nr:nucleotidyl transferase AbiEii/AbiGii toxin family protein [Candidatus Peregrinibacteria bacterium]
MQNLTKLINEAKRKSAGEQDILNLIREYLQVLILKAIYQSKYGTGLSFMGGTCLRICYDLKRFSEDLDFALDRKIAGYSFCELNGIVNSFLKNTDFETDVKINESKVVQKSFIRVSNILHIFGLSPLKSQKIHVKLEIDTRPVKVGKNEIETFFVTKFNEMFPILKHTDDTMFAGKICAVLNRAYTKGRDFYDLLWYLNRKKSINFNYLNRAFKQAGLKKQFKNFDAVITELQKKIDHTKVDDILKDIGRFLEDHSEEAVLKKYPDAFAQAVANYSIFTNSSNKNSVSVGPGVASG